MDSFLKICFYLSNEVATERASRSEGSRAAKNTKPPAAMGSESVRRPDQHTGNFPNITDNRAKPGWVRGSRRHAAGGQTSTWFLSRRRSGGSSAGWGWTRDRTGCIGSSL